VVSDFQSAFWEAKRALALASSEAFSRHGVHEGQQYVLNCLWEEDGLTPGEVARRLGLATPTITRSATRLEAAGFLRREPHPSDGRLVRLVLTAQGRNLEAAISAERAQIDKRALAGLSAVERKAFVTALRRMQDNLDRSRAKAG
jgi:DNA-binding MarR family transcriptional regulator